MSPSPFAHLHVHTEYSLLDGACRIEQLAARAAEMGLSGIAITDHGTMYGPVHFYKACRKHGVKPIIGCEIYVTDGSRTERQGRADAALGHLTLLAENQQGYANLVRLVTASHLEGFYYKPRADRELLARYGAGLIALSGCLSGKVPSAAGRGDSDGAARAACELRELFGPGNFFVELQDQRLEGQAQINEALACIARANGIPLVATNDVHYVRPEDAGLHDILLCIQTGSTLDQDKRLRFHSQEFYLKTPQEMAARFSHLPEALQNTNQIADRCDVNLDSCGFIIPRYPLPEGQHADGFLRSLCEQALRHRYPSPGQQITERLEYELRVIASKGVADYILIVWDFMEYGRRQGMWASLRGSAAGSLMLYLLGMTRVDPIALGLPFERFISPERGDMPDIDCDCEDEQRDELLRYVQQKYGPDRVAQIVTFNTLKARAAVRDVGRVLNVPLSEVDRVAKLIDPVHSVHDSLESNVELQHACQQSETIRRVVNIAAQIEGLPRHASTHAAGLVIASTPLSEMVPLQRPTAGGLCHTTQYDMDAIKQTGLVKIDLLGLRTLSVVKHAAQAVKAARGVDVNLDDMTYDDPKTYALLANGDTSGVFQLESAGMRAVLRDLRPDCLEDIIAVVALYRPGPMAEIENFISGKHGRRTITYLHPKLKPILQHTYGIIVYQEQVLEIAVRLAGFSMSHADDLRSAMKSKNEALMERLRGEFLRGCRDNGISEEAAMQIFARMRDFARYGFGKAHSACYAVLAYATACLKANYPVEFMAALLTSLIEHKDEMAAYVEECRRAGIAPLPPDVNRSQEHFSVEGRAIRFALAGIKHVSKPAIRALIEERESGGEFRDLFDFCSRIDPRGLNRAVLESLVKSGALDCLPGNRAAHLAALDQAMSRAQHAWRDRASGQHSLFGAAGPGLQPAESATLPNVPEFARDELLAMEKECLGVFLSDHPLSRVGERLDRITTARACDLSDLPPDQEVIVGGIVTSCRRFRTKSGQPMMTFALEDRTGAIEVAMLPDLYERQAAAVSQDAILLVRGHPDLPPLRAEGEQARSSRPRLRALAVAELSDEQAVTALRSGHDPTRPAAQRGRSQPPARTDDAGAAPTLHIQVASAALDGALLDRLRQTLAGTPGPCAVLLHVRDNGQEQALHLGPHFRVQYTPALKNAVQALLGAGSVWIEPHPQKG